MNTQVIDAGICAAVIKKDKESLFHFASQIHGSPKDIQKRYDAFLENMSNENIQWFFEALSGEKLESLTLEEEAQKKEIEKELAGATKNYVVKGTCLNTILENKLYRNQYPTFALYCKREWGVDKTTAHRYILGSKWHKILASQFESERLPRNEFVMRALIRNGNKTIGVVELWELALDRVKGRVPNSEDLENLKQELLTIKDPSFVKEDFVMVVNHDEDFQFWGKFLEVSANKYVIGQGSVRVKVSPLLCVAINHNEDTKLYERISALAASENKFVAKAAQSLHYLFGFSGWVYNLVDRLEDESK